MTETTRISNYYGLSIKDVKGVYDDSSEIILINQSDVSYRITSSEDSVDDVCIVHVDGEADVLRDSVITKIISYCAHEVQDKEYLKKWIMLSIETTKGKIDILWFGAIRQDEKLELAIK